MRSDAASDASSIDDLADIGTDARTPTDGLDVDGLVTGKDTVDDLESSSSDAGQEAVTDAFEDAIDVDASSDVTARCPPFDDGYRLAWSCDGVGQEQCRRWAQQYTDAGYAFARSVCGSGCVRANECSNLDSPDACMCGNEAPCQPGEICVAVAPDAIPSCRCIVSP